LAGKAKAKGKKSKAGFGGGGGGSSRRLAVESSHGLPSSPPPPHFMTAARPERGADGRPLGPDRLWARESPGPQHYGGAGDAFEALERGGVSGKGGRGVRLTEARRFEPLRRPDGSTVDHPNEVAAAAAMQAKATKRVKAMAREQAALAVRAARGNGGGGSVGGASSVGGGSSVGEGGGVSGGKKVARGQAQQRQGGRG